MVRLADIAKMAGVSNATVSRVLNKTAVVDKITRQKVLTAIEKTGYKPNLLAKGLRRKDSRLIGLLVPEIHHPTFSLIIQHIERYAYQHDFNLLLGNTQSNAKKELSILNDMLSRNINGVISLRVSADSRLTESMKNSKVPFIQIDRATEQSDFPYVMTDNYRAGRMAADYLVRCGHQQIVCVTGPLETSVAENRLKGFQDRLHESGIELPPEWIIEGDFTLEFGKKTALEIGKLKDKITAIWAQNDPMAIGIMNGLVRSGFQLPTEMSVMGMDDIDLATLVVPSLTTIRQPFDKMCELAVSQLMQTGNDLQNRTMLMPELVERESVVQIDSES